MGEISSSKRLDPLWTIRNQQKKKGLAQKSEAKHGHSALTSIRPYVSVRKFVNSLRDVPDGF